MTSGTSSVPTGRDPVLATRVSVGSICSVSAGSLTETGQFFVMLPRQRARAAPEMPSANSVTCTWMSSRMPSSKLLIAPRISTESGMMFSRTPPLIAPRVTTPGWRFRSMLRLTMGATPSHGAAPWVCLPCTLIFGLSLLAMVGPGR